MSDNITLFVVAFTVTVLIISGFFIIRGIKQGRKKASHWTDQVNSANAGGTSPSPAPEPISYEQKVKLANRKAISWLVKILVGFPAIYVAVCIFLFGLTQTTSDMWQMLAMVFVPAAVLIAIFIIIRESIFANIERGN